MKSEIKNNGLTYKSFPAVGKTIAYLRGCEDNVYQVINKLITNNSKYLDADYIGILNDLSISNQYRGVAKTNFSEGDKFNKAIGEEVAYGRVMQKYHKNFDTQMKEFLKDIRILEAATENYMDKRAIDYKEVPSVEDVKNVRFSSK